MAPGKSGQHAAERESDDQRPPGGDAAIEGRAWRVPGDPEFVAEPQTAIEQPEEEGARQDEDCPAMDIADQPADARFIDQRSRIGKGEGGRIGPGPVDQIAHPENRDIGEHQGREDLVHAEKGARDGRDERPGGASGHAGADHQRHRDHIRGAFRQSEADAGCGKGTEIELPLGADIPEPGAIGKRNGRGRKERSAPPCSGWPARPEANRKRRDRGRHSRPTDHARRPPSGQRRCKTQLATPITRRIACSEKGAGVMRGFETKHGLASSPFDTRDPSKPSRKWRHTIDLGDGGGNPMKWPCH